MLIYKKVININTNKLSLILYIMAALIIIIPASYVIITDIPFSSSFSKISIGVANVLVISGKLSTIFKKKKGDKSIPLDLGVIMGLLIAFIFHLIK